MGFTTLANLISDSYVGLGSPPVDYLSAEDICREVYRALGYYTQILSQSSENQVIAHCEFTPNKREWTISNAINLGVPAWIERQVYTGQYAVWQFVPLVNLAMVDDNLQRGVFSAGIYGEGGQLKIRFSYFPQTLPYRVHRLWFDPNPLMAQTLTGTADGTLFNGVPEAYSPMITGRAVKRLIPLMMSKASMSESKPDAELLTSWKTLLVSAADDVREWEQRYSHLVFGSRGAARSRRRRNILSKGGGFIGYWPGFKG